MATTNRWGAPWCWITWLTPILAGDACHWKVWFAARFKFQKRSRDFDVAAWTADHNARVRLRATELRADGWTVTVEDENSFTMKVGGVTLAGKADIIATRDAEAIVVDVKTGQQRDSDWWQVLIYLRVLPAARSDRLAGCRLRGEVQYADRSVSIAPEEVTETRRAEVAALLAVIASPDPPLRTPSPRECGFCDITANDCPERIDAGAAPLVEVEAF